MENCKEKSGEEDKVEITDNVEFSGIPTSWTQENITVTITHPNIPEGYEIQYKLEEGEWTTGESVVVEENGVIYGRLYNETTDDAAAESTKNISIIDKENPTAPTEIESIATSNSITVQASGGTDSISGVAGYQYRINSGNWTETKGSGKSYTFNELTDGTTYTIEVRTIDNAGRISSSNSKTIQTIELKEAVNAPVVKEGMIAVYYDNGWKKADANKDNWYNYHESKREWANVVTVKENGTKTRSYYQTSAEGAPIAEEDILAMFVWIPRYAYKITNGYHTAANGTGEIQIKFLEGVEDTYEGGTAVRQVDTNALTNGNKYVVHPAFTASNIGEEITGMWVGKFESSNASSPYNNEGITESSNENLKKGLGDGTTQDVTIRPNVTSWRWTEVTTMYDVCQAMNDTGNIHGLTSQTDTMMMKNSQWGAVAYLAQSNYGNKQIASDAESGIWNNPYNEGYVYENIGNKDYGMDSYSTNLTGMVGEKKYMGINTSVQVVSKEDKEDSITIKYNELKKISEGGGPNGTLGEEFTRTYYRYNTSNGVKGSTTRNIYGIYDMSGGSWEYMASFLANGTRNYVTTMKSKPLKYIEQYAGSGITNSEADQITNYEANKEVYGDAVYETSSEINGGNSWNYDYSYFPYLGAPFFARGGGYYDSSIAGVFCFYYASGATAHGTTFRVVGI